MDREGGSNGGSSSYYAVLGIRKDASFSDIRSAYRKLALVIIQLPSLFSPNGVGFETGVLGSRLAIQFEQIANVFI